MKTIGWVIFISSVCVSAMADDNGGNRDNWRFWSTPAETPSQFSGAAISNPTYTRECGSCHIAYQPGLLPARSWEKIMANFQRHFGSKTTLNNAANKSLTEFLVANSSDHSLGRWEMRIDESIRESQTPERVTQTGYFLRKHEGIKRSVTSVKSKSNIFSKCERCHPRAENGYYDAQEIKIPGVDRWDN